MPNADLALGRFGSEQPREAFIDLALLLAQLEILVANDRQTGAVITAIFEAPQSFNDHGASLLFADITDYSTHTF